MSENSLKTKVQHYFFNASDLTYRMYLLKTIRASKTHFGEQK